MDFQSTWLHRLYSEVVTYKSTTNQLFKMLSVFDRGDSFIGFFSNVLLFSHLKTFIRLEKWKAANREILPKLIDSISEWETIVSLTIFAIKLNDRNLSIIKLRKLLITNDLFIFYALTLT
jgi:hypothetical protein